MDKNIYKKRVFAHGLNIFCMVGVLVVSLMLLRLPVIPVCGSVALGVVAIIAIMVNAFALRVNVQYLRKGK